MERARIWWTASAIITAMLAIALLMPIAPPPPELEPDLSLRATIHDAFARRMQIGTEIISTYGPWGILERGDTDPRTSSIVLIATSVVALLFVFALMTLARDAGTGPGVTSAIAVAASALLAAGGSDPRFLAVQFLGLLSCLVPKRSAWRESPLIALLAFIGLIKLSYLVVALFVVIMMVWIRRRLSYALLFGATLIVGWLAAGQRLSNFPAFIMRGAAVVAGYSGAQALPHPSAPALWFAIGGAAGLWLLTAFMERDVARTTAIAGALILAIKIGYVRYDEPHAATADTLLLFLAVGYLLLRVTHSRLAHLRRGLTLAAGLAIGVIIVADGPILADTFRADWSWLRDRETKMARLRSAASDVPFIRGTVDAYPWGSAALIAHGAAYAPRPIFESHLAWTPSLIALNTRHLQSPGAASWLWVSSGSIDRYPPLLQDGPSWPEIISRYDFDRRIGDHLLLRRRVPALVMTRIPIATLIGRFGQDLALPDPGDGLLWCSFDVAPSQRARLAALLARPARLTVRLTTASGDDIAHVIPVAMGSEGFILSPAIETTDDLDALTRARDARVLSSRRVVRICAGVESVVAHPFGERFTLRLERVAFAVSPR
jgi:hypothetical protein